MPAVDWNPGLHPRDRTGQFIRKFDLVSIFSKAGDKLGEGQIVGNSRGSWGHDYVSIALEGRLVRLPSSRVRVAPDGKARLGVPDTRRSAGGPDVDTPYPPGVAIPGTHYEGLDKPTEAMTYCAKGHKHWGTLGAAGMLIRHIDQDGNERWLMQKRSPYVQHGGTWSVPGGAITPEHPDPVKTGVVEANEELGDIPEPHPVRTVTVDHGGWAYTTVIADAPEMFEPGGSGETAWEQAEAAWLTMDEIRKAPLHPGFAATLPLILASEKEPDEPVTAAGPTKVGYSLLDALKKAVPNWDPSKHPRDREGRFLEVGDVVRAYHDKESVLPEAVGQISASYFDAPTNRMFIGIDVGGGKLKWYRPKQLENIKAKATLTPKLPLPSLDEKNDEVHWDQIVPTADAGVLAEASKHPDSVDPTPLKDLPKGLKAQIGLVETPAGSDIVQTDKAKIPAGKTPEDMLGMLTTTMINKGLHDQYPGGLVQWNADFDSMLADTDYNSASQKLAKLMTAAKLGGKQRKRYNSFLAQKHGGSTQAMKPVGEPHFDEPDDIPLPSVIGLNPPTPVYEAPEPGTFDATGHLITQVPGADDEQVADYKAAWADGSDVNVSEASEKQALLEMYADDLDFAAGVKLQDDFGIAVGATFEDTDEPYKDFPGQIAPDGTINTHVPGSDPEMVDAFTHDLDSALYVSKGFGDDPEKKPSAVEAMLKAWLQDGGETGVTLTDLADVGVIFGTGEEGEFTETGNPWVDAAQRAVLEFAGFIDDEKVKEYKANLWNSQDVTPHMIEAAKNGDLNAAAALLEVYADWRGTKVTAEDLGEAGVPGYEPAEPAPITPPPAVAPKPVAPAKVWPGPTTLGAYDTVYSHPQGSVIVVEYDTGKVTKYKPDGKKASTSATADNLAQGHGKWTLVGTGPEAINTYNSVHGEPEPTPTPEVPKTQQASKGNLSKSILNAKSVAQVIDAPAGAGVELKSPYGKIITLTKVGDDEFHYPDNGTPPLNLDAVKLWINGGYELQTIVPKPVTDLAGELKADYANSKGEPHDAVPSDVGIAKPGDSLSYSTGSSTYHVVKNVNGGWDSYMTLSDGTLQTLNPADSDSVITAVNITPGITFYPKGKNPSYPPGTEPDPQLDESTHPTLKLLETSLINKGLYDTEASELMLQVMTTDPNASYEQTAVALAKLMTKAKLGGKQRKRYKDALAKKFAVKKDQPAAAPAYSGPAGSSPNTWNPVVPSPTSSTPVPGVIGPTKGNELVQNGGATPQAAKSNIQDELSRRMEGKVTSKQLIDAVLNTGFNSNVATKQLAEALKTGKFPSGTQSIKKASYGNWEFSGSPHSPTAKKTSMPADMAGVEFALRSTIANSLIGNWASTSNDSNVRSLALQEAAIEEFGLKDTYEWDSAGAMMKSNVKKELEVNGALYRTFLRAMYENTQAWAKANGITKVRLRRGSSVYAGPVGSTVKVKLRPMSSFSTNKSTANGFGSNRIEAFVPVEWIIGTAATGFGCRNEYEWVVLGGVHEVRVTA